MEHILTTKRIVRYEGRNRQVIVKTYGQPKYYSTFVTLAGQRPLLIKTEISEFLREALGLHDLSYEIEINKIS